MIPELTPTLCVLLCLIWLLHWVWYPWYDDYTVRPRHWWQVACRNLPRYSMVSTIVNDDYRQWPSCKNCHTMWWFPGPHQTIPRNNFVVLIGRETWSLAFTGTVYYYWVGDLKLCTHCVNASRTQWNYHTNLRFCTWFDAVLESSLDDP